MEDFGAIGITLHAKRIGYENAIHIPARQGVQRVNAIFTHLLRRGNTQRLHRLQELWNSLAVFVPELCQLSVVNHELAAQDFYLLGLADLYQFRVTFSQRNKRHEAFHVVYLVLLAAEKLHLFF